MVWSVVLSSDVVQKQLRQLDVPDRDCIFKFLAERFDRQISLRDIGKPLVGLAGENLWRYGVGSYRIGCRLDDEKRIIEVLAIGHRSSVYKR